MTRVKVFVDYQNLYMGARESFGDPRLDLFTFGQVDPRRLGLMLTAKGDAVDPERALAEVRVYRGQPDARHSPTAETASMRQVDHWRSQERVMAITRPLLYQPIKRRAGRPVEWVAREKGIDVRIALDMAIGAATDQFDVAVLFSADTDLVPALEAVLELGKRAEVAAWRAGPGRRFRHRLLVPGRNVWCHWLGREDFEWVSDGTDYTKAATG